MRQKLEPFLSKVYRILFWAPLPIWIVLLLFGAALVKLHALFSVIVALTPVFSFLIVVYYGIIFLLRKTQRHKVILISILAIIFVSYTDHWISYGPSPSQDNTRIKVITWNVQRLGALHDASVESNNLNVLKDVLDEINADVAVIEEVSYRQLNRILQAMGLKSSQALWTNYYSGSKGGLAVILLNNVDWEISNKQVADLPPSWKCSMTELRHSNGQTINVLGVHISPPKVSDREVKTSVKKMLKGERSGIKTILRRYVHQNNIQNRQLDKVSKMVSQFNDPTIVAGDFNSTNQLPLHKKMRATLSDAWLEGGNGMGATRYWGNIIPFRIDYIYTTNDFNITKTQVGSAKFSDHNPVISEMFLD